MWETKGEHGAEGDPPANHQPEPASKKDREEKPEAKCQPEVSSLFLREAEGVHGAEGDPPARTRTARQQDGTTGKHKYDHKEQDKQHEQTH